MQTLDLKQICNNIIGHGKMLRGERIQEEYVKVGYPKLESV
jgi:hypothetical protein